jgi:hypothetical protein
MSNERQNSGVLWRNREKKDGRHPSLKGDGVTTVSAEYIKQHWDGHSDLVLPLDIAVWTKQGERAGKFLSLAIKLKGDQKSAPQGAKAPGPERGEQPKEDPPW